MKDSDYPDLFRSADAVSLVAQQRYVRLFRIDLILLVGAGVFALLRSIAVGQLAESLGITAAVALSASMVCKLIMRAKRYDRIWFDCRAVAESAKTATWRYMIGVHPYDINADSATADRKFVSELEGIRKARPTVIGELAAFPCDGERITFTMRQTRQLLLADRKQLYLERRLREQMGWYRRKSKMSSDADECAFWLVIAIQVVALAVSIAEIVKPEVPNVLAVFVSVAAAVLAWSEMKRYKDLANTYALAADDLASAEAVWVHIANEMELQDRVAQTEEAISREHTMWIAKRTS